MVTSSTIKWSCRQNNNKRTVADNRRELVGLEAHNTFIRLQSLKYSREMAKARAYLRRRVFARECLPEVMHRRWYLVFMYGYTFVEVNVTELTSWAVLPATWGRNFDVDVNKGFIGVVFSWVSASVHLWETISVKSRWNGILFFSVSKK